MATSETIDKSNNLPPAADFNFLRRQGIKHIEKLAGDVWTDYNTHDPGITLLEALCYAITDLAYRTNFDMKDLLSQSKPDGNGWKNIFYTAREILPCNPLTINDYRKLIMDVDGVRNAWITISKDVEVPMFINRKQIADNFPTDTSDKSINSCGCGDKIKFPYPNAEEPKVKGLVFSDDVVPASKDDYKVIELNGLYKIIVEYEEEIREKQKEHIVRAQVLKVLHRRRNVCEDYVSVTGAEYKDFFLQTNTMLSEDADPDMILAEMCYRVQNYFTPVIHFYSLEDMEKEFPVDEIFEGPALKHGFIKDEELERTDMFRDMRLSDIINLISDIEGVNALRLFKIVETPEEGAAATDVADACSNEEYFDEWIGRIKMQKLVGRLSLEDMLKFFHPSEEDLISPVSDIHFYKPSGEVFINTDRFQKLLNDLKGRDKYMKMEGFKNNYPVPTGENMELENFYPVQYELPFNYRVGETGLPLREGNKRLIQSLQLKGYLAVFEQVFLNYLYRLGSMNELFSFNDIKFKGETKHKPYKSPCEPDHKHDHDDEQTQEEDKEFVPPAPNQIIYKDEEGKIAEKIIGYKCLYYDAEKYISELQAIIQPEGEFEWQRNVMLDHLLARFNEEMGEYVSLMKYMYPNDYLLKVIKNKTDLLADYPAISNNRARAYNYKLEVEATDYPNKKWDEEKIKVNISGLEKRIARLIGLKDYDRKDLSPYHLFIEEVKKDGKTLVKVVLYEDDTREKILLETKPVASKCTDDLMHAFIDSGCCGNNFIPYPEQRSPFHRVHNHQRHEEYSFVLRDKEGQDIAKSPVYYSDKHRDKAMKLARCYMERICHNEGFHMIEHILLRPRGDNQLTDGRGNKYGEAFKLLDICLDKCDLAITKEIADTVNYKFDIQVLPPERCLDGKRWNVVLHRISTNPPIKILEHSFKEFEQASDFIAKVREYGSELINFVIYKTRGTINNFYFKLKDKIGNTLVESSCFSTFDPVVEEKATPGRRTECSVVVTDKGVYEEIRELKKFLAYEYDLYCCEEPCDHNEDPYSFRVTFVLPCWTKRFRNKSFRKFVEKTIQSETPAHIQANIFWLGITEMRNYEEPYFNWLIETAANDVPDIGICNDFIKQLKGLKNCDEHCIEPEDTDKPGAGMADQDAPEIQGPVPVKKPDGKKPKDK